MANFKELNVYNNIKMLGKVCMPLHHSAVKWINHLAKFVSRHFRTTTIRFGKLACNAQHTHKIWKYKIEINGKQCESSNNQIRIK